jgi:hypothetical protein
MTWYQFVKWSERPSQGKNFSSNAVLKMIKGRTRNSVSWLLFLAVIRCYLAGAIAKWRGFLPRTPTALHPIGETEKMRTG